MTGSPLFVIVVNSTGLPPLWRGGSPNRMSAPYEQLCTTVPVYLPAGSVSQKETWKHLISSRMGQEKHLCRVRWVIEKWPCRGTRQQPLHGVGSSTPGHPSSPLLPSTRWVLSSSSLSSPRCPDSLVQFLRLMFSAQRKISRETRMVGPEPLSLSLSLSLSQRDGGVGPLRDVRSLRVAPEGVVGA